MHLILFNGPPGSGRTTSSRFALDWLTQRSNGSHERILTWRARDNLLAYLARDRSDAWEEMFDFVLIDNIAQDADLKTLSERFGDWTSTDQGAAWPELVPPDNILVIKLMRPGARWSEHFNLKPYNGRARFEYIMNSTTLSELRHKVEKILTRYLDAVQNPTPEPHL